MSNVRRQESSDALSSQQTNSPPRIAVTRPVLNADLLTRALQGQQVSHVSAGEVRQLVIHFSNGTTLVVEANGTELKTAKYPKAPSPTQDARQPTKRQFEYLAFIAKYSARFGGAPAESDIERHFLVTAPSVNQMMQALERHGFITRQRGVPRSVRICIELPQQYARPDA